MQIIGTSAAALNAQPLNPVFFVKPAKSDVQAAQSTTILLASSSQSDHAGQARNSFMYVASSSGGITLIEEMTLSSSISTTVGGDQSSSSFFEVSSIFANSGAATSYDSATTLSISAGESSNTINFNALA